MNRFMRYVPIPSLAGALRANRLSCRFVISLFCLLTFSSLLFAAPSPAPEIGEWKYFKEHFISGDGRVIDRVQNDMSHSEGQGYGMLLAVKFEDKPLFDKLLQWTGNNLQVRKDSLSAWGWGKRPNEEWTVIDYNNAADGDVLIAYALIQAEQKWKQKTYAKQALTIVQNLRTHMAIKLNNRTFLLSGYYGFADAKGLVLNPAYQIFPAYQAFAKIDDRQFWEKVHNDARYLLDESSRNPANLPADWVLAEPDGSIKIYAAKSSRFSYEAVRVLLYLAWAKLPPPAGTKNVLDYYQKHGRIPVWFDLTKEEVSGETASAGFYAIFARAAEQLDNANLATRLHEEATQRLQNEQNDYYSHALYLLAGIE